MARLALLACVLLVLAGCGGYGDDSPDASATPTTKPAAAERFGYIRSVSTAGPTATLAFDEAEWLTGEEAQRAAEEDGVVAPGEPVPNDYYVRNSDKSTATLLVLPSAEITARRCPLCRKGQPGNVDDFLAAFMKYWPDVRRSLPRGQVAVLADDPGRHRLCDRRAVRPLTAATSGRCRTSSPGIGAFSAAEIPSASTRRVSSGSMIPSSQRRAVE